MSRIVILQAEDPPDCFPDIAGEEAFPDGLVAIGGDLAPERLLAAYRRGIFPWYEAGQPVLWWCPEPRAVLRLGALRISRSLRRRLQSDAFEVSIDLDFPAVIDACAALRADTGTWITPDMRRAYLRLHELGYAHSIETWSRGELVGGLYGVAIGRMFFGESMFSTASDASKVALVRLVEQVGAIGGELIDCQLPNAHLATLGCTTVPRREFLQTIARLTTSDRLVPAWRQERRGTTAPGPACLRGQDS
jgi:leucyl/phenylalanyl-tRNA--protein transferase